MTSRGASWLAKPLVNASDPMSGFFATKKSLMLEFGQEATGFKIGMEILVRGGDSLRVNEIPIVFHDLQAGDSKFGTKEIITYLRQLVRLAGGNMTLGNGVRFGIVGLLGFFVDFGLFNLLITFLVLNSPFIGKEAVYMIQLATVITFIGGSTLVVLNYPTPVAVSDRLRRD